MYRIDVRKLVDEASFNSFHATILVWCLLITAIDGYDLTVTGIALPSIMQQMGVSAVTAGFMTSSALFGMMFGSIFLGTLSDRIGRRRTLAICIFLFSVFTAAAGFTSEPVSFSILRFVAGLGLGGAMPNVIAQMTEYSPKKIRSLVTTIMYSGYGLGAILAAVLGKLLLVDYGWQAVFFAAAPPVVLIPCVLRWMPDSLTHLIANRDDSLLRAIVRRLRPDMDIEKSAVFLQPGDNRTSGVPIARLFQEGRSASTVLFWAAIITGLFMVYSLITWLTKLMAMSGYSLGSALSFVIAMNIGTIVGAIGGGWLADKLHIKWVLVSMYALGSLFLCLMTMKMPTALLYVVMGAVGVCTTGAQIVAYVYCGVFYPTAIRSTGIGMAVGVGRLGAIVAPPLLGMMVALKLPLQQNFLVIAGTGIVAALLFSLIDHSRSASSGTDELRNDALSQTERRTT
ncbi:MFS transporter [Burkholderia sp. Bp9142]|uniref:MFS transporter n=1 Tax=Burkholderia sp. Bp9142 TaxID=2184573 RepID=UPI000F5939D3|nr:MFS transporter [Burkholderia sp. Bp9142]RQR33326.1 MFS transporter [Burkholderia sp. Bp9142]